MPLIIGVTGSIATGKSTACSVMSEMGAVHCDADRLVHRLYDPGTDAFDRIVGIFGEEIVGADGFIDRRILGAKVFGKPEQMNKLTTAIGSIADAVKGVIDEWNRSMSANEVAVLEAVNWSRQATGSGVTKCGCSRAMTTSPDADLLRETSTLMKRSSSVLPARDAGKSERPRRTWWYSTTAQKSSSSLRSRAGSRTRATCGRWGSWNRRGIWRGGKRGSGD